MSSVGIARRRTKFECHHALSQTDSGESDFYYENQE